MNKITIRQAAENDIPILESILLDTVNWVSEIGEPLWNKEDVLWEKLSMNYQINDFYITYVDDVPSGCMALIDYDPFFWPDVKKGESLFIHKLAVIKAARKSGVSGAMIDFFIEQGVKRGAKTIRLDTDALRPKTRAFYERHGFVFIETKIMGKFHVAFYVHDMEPTPTDYRHYAKDRDKPSFKDNIKKYYDTEAELRNSKSVKVDWKVQARKKFYELIKRENKKSLLELGAGAGYDSQFFMNNGLNVVAVDLSSEMVKNCREKSIEAYELDFYNLSSLDRKFDCVYAINTLLHVPKNDLRHVLNEINLVLETGGLFYMGLYGGQDTESEFIKSEVSDAPRFFAFHSDAYLKTALGNYVEILDFETLDIGSGAGVNTAVNIFHSITMRKIIK